MFTHSPHQSFYDINNSGELKDSPYTVDLDTTLGDSQRTATLLIPASEWDVTWTGVSRASCLHYTYITSQFTTFY